MVARRGKEAGDDQLPHLQTGAGWSFLRANLWAGQGLRVQLRQVQAHEAPGSGLRKVRRRGDSVEGSPRAAWAHHPCHTGRAHLVSEVASLANRQPARHHAQRSGKSPLLRKLHRHRPEEHATAEGRADLRGEIAPAPRRARRGQLRRRDGRRGGPRAAQGDRREQALRRATARNAGYQLRSQAEEVRQAAQGGGGVSHLGKQARMDDARRHPGDPARPAAAGSARRRPVRHLGPQ